MLHKLQCLSNYKSLKLLLQDRIHRIRNCMQHACNSIMPSHVHAPISKMFYACLCHLTQGLPPLLHVLNTHDCIFHGDNILIAPQSVHGHKLQPARV